MKKIYKYISPTAIIINLGILIYFSFVFGSKFTSLPKSSGGLDGMSVFMSICLLFILALIGIDYIGVVNIEQAPRFSLVKVSGNNVMYYDTPFYDVVRCNVGKENETFTVIKNQKYDKDNIDLYCK